MCGWAVARIRGEQPPSFDEFMKATMPVRSGEEPAKKYQSTDAEAAAIIEEFAPIIAAEKEGRARRG